MTPMEIEALSLSLQVAAWAVIASVPLAVPVAWVLARRSFPGKTLLDGIVHLPLVLPPVVTGYVLLVVLGRNGAVGSALESIGLTFAFDWKGAAVASAVMSFPLLVRAARISMEAVDPALEAAASTLGAGPARIFLRVTLPLSLPGVLAGSILAFARSLGEFGATITFVSNIPGQTRTLPLAIYTLTQVPGGDAGAMRLCAISIAVSLLALLGSELLGRRLTERLGRASP